MKDRTGQIDEYGNTVVLDLNYLTNEVVEQIVKMAKKRMIEALSFPSVPVTELKRLHDQIGEIEYQTDRERNILWSCQAMLLDCIESYEGSDAE